MNTPIYLCLVVLAVSTSVLATFAAWRLNDHVARWRQRRLVAKLIEEDRARYDERALIKAKIVTVGHIIELRSFSGGPMGDQFALSECWEFDIANGSIPFSFDSKKVVRWFGYTKADLIYIAEHASEFVDA